MDENLDLKKQNFETMLSERDKLREELKHLKDCQVKYFILSVTVTGALMGIGGKDLSCPLSDFFVLLAPLTVLLPCWWIFFDKATSIARIVGYYRILEKMIIGNNEYKYMGWENSLRECRNKETEENNIGKNNELSKRRLKETLRQIKEYFPTVSSMKKHLYWVINWWTFFVLSLLCLLRSMFSIKSFFHLAFIIILILTVWESMFFTLKILHELVKGNRSYDACQKRWEDILRIEESTG